MAEVTTLDEGLLLALLNTTPTVAGEVTDRLAHSEDAHAWLAEYSDEGHLDEDLELLRSTRDTLQALVRGESAPTTLAPALHGVSYQAVIGDTGITWELATPREHALAARAVVAWDALQHAAPGPLMREHRRVHPVPHRPLQEQQRPMVLDGRLRQPPQGASPLRTSKERPSHPLRPHRPPYRQTSARPEGKREDMPGPTNHVPVGDALALRA